MINKWNDEYDKYFPSIQKARDNKDLKLENEILDQAIEAKVFLPYVYLRKAKLLKEEKI